MRLIKLDEVWYTNRKKATIAREEQRRITVYKKIKTSKGIENGKAQEKQKPRLNKFSLILLVPDLLNALSNTGLRK